jgi:Ras-related protein Rap-1A
MSVGKSCLTWRFIRDEFIEEYEPTVSDVYNKQYIDKKGITQNIKIQDTAGASENLGMMEAWMRDKDGLIFVYSIDIQDSLKDL